METDFLCDTKKCLAASSRVDWWCISTKGLLCSPHSAEPRSWDGRGNIMVSSLNFTMWPQRIFGMNSRVVDEQPDRTGKGWMESVQQLESMEDVARKRLREEEDKGGSRAAGSRTPALVSSRRRLEVGVNEHQLEHDDRPIKRFRGERVVVAVSAPRAVEKEEPKSQSGLLGTLPEDVVSHCLSFLNSTEDRFALQTTCKQFRQISNSDKMLRNIQVGGDRETGKNGIIQDVDTPESAAVALAPFSRAGNLEAIYM